MSDLLNPVLREIELGGERFALRFELGDFRRAERSLKTALFPIGATAAWREATTLEQVCLSLYVGLQHAKPDVTVEWIEERVALDNYAAINAVVLDAVADFFARLSGTPLETVRAAMNAISTGTALPPGADSTTA